MTLNEKYEEKCNTPSDINQLLPTLRKYASECTHVTEMGVRTIVSTYALLAGLQDKFSQSALSGYLNSIDLYHPKEHGGNLEEAEAIADKANVNFKFIQGSTLELDIYPTDMLFIDTLHVYGQLLGELERHSGKVRKYIAMHDTTTFGMRGEDKNQLGLWYAVEEFLQSHPEWKIKEKLEYCNGLTILERVSNANLCDEAKIPTSEPSNLDTPVFIPVFGIPVLNRGDLLERLVSSLDCPIGKLFIVNNGNDDSVWQAISKIRLGLNPLIQEVVVYSESRNLGVAPSWNHIIKSNPTAPYWFICAVDMKFEKGSLAKMYRAAEAAHKSSAALYADGYSCFCITQLGWEGVGQFDENIYPAYLEDCDHHYRVKLSGLPYVDIPDMKLQHGDGLLTGSVTINSNPQYARANSQTHGNNFKYYMKKWGGVNGQEVFRTPFNGTLHTYTGIGFWEIDKDFRREQERIWRETV